MGTRFNSTPSIFIISVQMLYIQLGIENNQLHSLTKVEFIKRLLIFKKWQTHGNDIKTWLPRCRRNILMLRLENAKQHSNWLLRLDWVEMGLQRFSHSCLVESYKLQIACHLPIQRSCIKISTLWLCSRCKKCWVLTYLLLCWNRIIRWKSQTSEC